MKLNEKLFRIASILKESFIDLKALKETIRRWIETCNVGTEKINENPRFEAPDPTAKTKKWVSINQFFSIIKEIAKEEEGEIELDEFGGTSYHVGKENTNVAAKAWSYFAGGREIDLGFLEKGEDAFLLMLYFRYWFKQNEALMWEPLTEKSANFIMKSYDEAIEKINDIDL